jgi:bacterial leucyl aminopeptidase
MKLSNTSLLALLLPVASARFVEPSESNRVNLYPDGLPAASQDTEKYHIELSPGDRRWVTEDEKWALRRVRPTPLVLGKAVADWFTQEGKRFFDITDNADLGSTIRVASKSVFPKKIAHQKEVNPLLEKLSKKEMEDHLTKFTSFHTRYYKVRSAIATRAERNSRRGGS